MALLFILFSGAHAIAQGLISNGATSALGAQPTPLETIQESPPRPMISPDEIIPTIQFPNADVRSLLDFYERLTGLHPIYDATVQGQVSLVVTHPVSAAEAVQLIESSLLINGFTLVPGPGNSVKVVVPSKNPRQFAVPIISDPAMIPPGDQVISFVFKLDYAEPAEIQQAIAQYVSPSPYTSFVPLPKSQSLLVTESADVIRNLAFLIRQLDREPARVVSEFIPLYQADAATIIEILNKIFEKPPTQPASISPRPPGEQGATVSEQQGIDTRSKGPTAVLSEDSLIVGKIRLTADVRTNRIHVVTRPVNMPFIRRLIAEYDSNLPFGQPTTYPLRFVSAGDVLEVIVKAITEPGTKTDESGGDGGRRSGASRAQPVSNPNNLASQKTEGTGRSSINVEELTTEESDTTPEARTVGNAKIIADKRSNAIIVLGNNEVKSKIARVLAQIDVRAPQVMITAVIGELSLDDKEEFGVDYLLQRSSLARSGTTGLIGSGISGVVNNVGTNTGFITAAGLPTTAGVTALIGVTNSFDIIVSLLESTGRFRVTSRPMVFTSNNKKATIASGQQVPVPGTIQSSLTNGVLNNQGLVTNSNVEYKDVDLKLEVLPLINSEREVTLDIVQTVNNITGFTTISGNQIPNISSRRIKTTVSLANQATVVLGGLVTENKNDNKEGIPVLKDVPVLGYLFGSKKKRLQRTELIVLIRPTVTVAPVEVLQESERVSDKHSFMPDLDDTLDPKGIELKTFETGRDEAIKKRPAQLRNGK